MEVGDIGTEQEINMKQNSVDEKTVKITKFPCPTIGPCLEYEEDYDPCGNCHDITEKDLEILARIEVATLKAKTKPKAKWEQEKERDKRKWDKEKGGRNSKQEDGEKRIQRDDERRWSKEKAGRNSKQEGGGKNIQKDNGRSSKSSRKLTDESTNKGKVDIARDRETVGGDDAVNPAVAAASATATATAASTGKRKRKPCQKKVKKYPFHRDRLALPSCLSPPPRFPPPQLHPPADEFEDVECSKPKKPKPCRKKTIIKKIKTISKEENKSEVKEETEQEVTEEQYYEETEEKTKEEKEETTEESTEEEEDDDEEIKEKEEEEERNVEEIREETETKAEGMNEKRIEEVKRRTSEGKPVKRSTQEEKPKKLGEFVSKNRKPCMRRVQKPCKKKISEISISLLPPLIPPLQRDLPSTSPKNIPEVKRQTLMAEETKRMVKRGRCKNRITNKAKNY